MLQADQMQHKPTLKCNHMHRTPCIAAVNDESEIIVVHYDFTLHEYHVIA
jgi:hypothetical protein